MLKQTYYGNRIDLFEKEYNLLKRKSMLFSLLRLIIFIGIVLFLILYFTVGHYLLFIIFSFLFMVSFVVIVIKHNDLENSMLILSSKIQINNEEILLLNHDYHHRKSGNEYEEINPQLSRDFGLFGKGSLFQYLNRCNTNIGQTMMAQKLCYAEKDAHLIIRKQSAINELCAKNDFVQDFQSYSKLLPDYKDELSIFLNWLTMSNEPISRTRYVALILGVTNTMWLLLSSFGILTWTSFLIPVILSQLFNLFNRKRFRLGINDSVNALAKSIELLKLIEDEPFDSDYLNSLKRKLTSDKSKASTSLNSFSMIYDAYVILNNALIHFFLNTLLLLDVHIYHLFLEWKKNHKDEVEDWFSTIGNMEVLISFSTYSFNNLDCVTYPTMSDDVFKIEAVELGHPLIKQSVRVNNDFSVNGVPSIQIITGANMAGKSTFLRTLAVNLLIAMNGAPVIAKKFVFFPCDILSSIKVQDSLMKNESYFYAELLRLNEIIEHVRNNPKTLVIFDEILRGTNTKDKQIGSIGILQKLISLNAMVVIATHDLSLGELENSFSGIVYNRCFEVELTDDQLFFDYKLKNGVSKKLNASFLLHKMGIID